MKAVARKTRSRTRTGRSQRVEILIKTEEDLEITDASFNQHELATPILGLTVKIEENDVNLKSSSPSLQLEKDGSADELGSRNHCNICKRNYSNKASYDRHCRTATHQRLLTRKSISPTAIPDEFDANCHCIVCNRFFNEKRNYRQHLKRVHKMKLTSHRPTPDPSICPNPDNASNYCDSCNWKFSLRSHYRIHLLIIHQIIIPKQPRTRPDPSISPDVDDPNFQCKSCQTKYKNRNKYRQHLRYVHRMELLPLRKKPIYDRNTSLDDTLMINNKSCTICKVKYRNKYLYQAHMKNHHKVGRNTPIIRGRKVAHPNISPDPNDPNWFCLSCQRRYSSRCSYERHIRSMHPHVNIDNTGKKLVNSIMVEMDAGNAKNKRCTICDREYINRYTYRRHMLTIHKDGKREAVSRLRDKGRVNPNIIPIWDDPNSYCRSCNQTFSTKWSYRKHIKTQHSKVLQESVRLSSSNPTQ